MKPIEFKSFLKKSLEKNPKRSIFVYGGVGVGKSSCVKQVADELGYELRDIRLSLLDSVDLRGLPDIDKVKKETYWTKPIFLPPENYDKDLILFLDEFNTASASVQNACLQLVLDRGIGEYHLPERTVLICAGNNLGDGGFTFRLSSALRNRFINIDFEINFDDWKIWAFRNNINPLIMGYHNWTKGDKLHSYKNDVDNKAFTTPRSWQYASEILDIGLENGTLFEALKGVLGEGIAVEFYGFLKIYRDLPNPDDILIKGKDIVPTESNILYALVSALINGVRQNKTLLDRLIKYSLKIPKEFSVVMVKDLLKTDLKDDVMKSKTFDLWIQKNKDVIL